MSTTQPIPIDVPKIDAPTLDVPSSKPAHRTTTTASTTATTTTTSVIDIAPPPTAGAYATQIAMWLAIALVGAMLGRVSGAFRRRGDVLLPRPRWLPEHTANAIQASPDGTLLRQAAPPPSAPLWIGAGLMFGGSTFFPAIGLLAIGKRSDSPALSAEGGLLLMSGMYVATLILIAAYHRAMRWRMLPTLGLSRGWNLSDLGIAGLAALIAIPLTNVAALLTQMMWESLQYKHETVHALLQLMGKAAESPWVPTLAVLNAVLLAPLFEELLFRGHLQTAIGMRLHSRGAAIVITSLLFASIHETWMMPPIFVLSLMLGYVYERTNSLWVSILLHVAFNSVSTAIFLLVRSAG